MTILARTLLVIGLMLVPSLISAATPTPVPVSSCCGKGAHGAPGPIVGAGLPVLAIGYGIYWLVQRRRKAY